MLFFQPLHAKNTACVYLLHSSQAEQKANYTKISAENIFREGIKTMPKIIWVRINLVHNAVYLGSSA